MLICFAEEGKLINSKSFAGFGKTFNSWFSLSTNPIALLFLKTIASSEPKLGMLSV